MKKIGILALVLVVALSAIGMGYAWWTQSLTINGTVNTGNLLVGIADLNNPDAGEGQSVGTVDSTDYYYAINEDISGAYPGYEGSATVGIANFGTIPVILVDVNFSQGEGDFDLDNIIVGDWTYTNGSTVITGSGLDFSSLAAEQLAVDGTASLEISYTFSTEMGNETMDQSASFQIVLDFTQFNYVPASPV